jgi:hypothetical protein
MPRKPKPAPDDPEQSKLFIQTVKEKEVRTTGAEFKRAINIVLPKKDRANKTRNG